MQTGGGKYQWLVSNDLANTSWKIAQPKSPFYLFSPQEDNLLDEYNKGWKVPDIFPVNSVGIVTARDEFTIHWTKDEVWQVVQDFIKLGVEEARQKYNLGKDVREWQVGLAQQDVKKSGPAQDKLTPIMYRPFDIRYTYYTGNSRGFHCRPREETMQHMTNGSNLALCTTRSIEIGRGWEHIFCTKQMIQHHTVSLKEVNYLFPLYLYSDPSRKTLFDFANETGGDENPNRSVNIAAELIREIEEKLGLQWVDAEYPDLRTSFGPRTVFNYIYAVLHSKTYRNRYAQFLKTDFPRIPITSQWSLFNELCTEGSILSNYHFLEYDIPELNERLVKFKGVRDNRIDDIKYVATTNSANTTGSHQEGGQVWINDQQYFETVPLPAWEFYIGGYQVLSKWLKDRKGRKLTLDEIEHYKMMVMAIHQTIGSAKHIDEFIDKYGGWPLL